jgi:hypothetical protein
MDPSLLLPLSMYTDFETTNNLIKSSDIFNEVPDIWRLKFNHDYPNRKYLDFWSSETNYRLQDKQWAVMIVGEPIVDRVLYEYNDDDIKKHILGTINQELDRGIGFEAVSLIKIEVNKRYVLIYTTKHHCWSEISLLYASTFEEAESLSKELLRNCNESDDESDEVLGGFIIDLSKMIPEFCYKKNTLKDYKQFYTKF